MARHEQDREDLIVEARALVNRAELRVPGATEPVVLGQRTNGWFSVYFHPELVFHFNEQGQLRRAYVAGLMYRSGPLGLARLRRNREGVSASELLRDDLSPAECEEFLLQLATQLRGLMEYLRQGRVEVLREVVPAGAPPPDWQHLLDQTVPPRLAGRVGPR